MDSTLPAFFVFFGTRTALVHAADEEAAFAAFLEALSTPPKRNRWHDPQPRDPRFGRIMPPARDEVTIRRPRPEDRAWLAESESEEFKALLDGLVDA